VRLEQSVPPPLSSGAAGGRPARQAEDGATLAVTLYPASTANYATYAIAQLRTVVVGAQPTWADAFDYWASCCYVAAPGREPTRFPQGVEFAWGLYANPNAAQEALNNAALTTNLRLSTTFTVLFSPSGQVLIRPAFVIKRHNRDSVFYSPDYPTPSSNTDPNLDPRPADVVPLLLPDDLVGLTLTTNPATWVTGKSSQNYLWLYDQTARKQAGATPWTSYLSLHQKEARILINPYTGQLQEPSGP